jgi:hypothetical protein
MAQTTIQGSFLDSTLDITSLVLSGASPLVFEGATVDAFETTLAFVDPTADRVITIPNATDTLLGKATTDTLTNKTFDADGTGNSLTNVENANVKAAAAIALNKLAATTASRALVSDGTGFVSASSVTATTLGYLDATSSIQTQMDAKATLATPTFTTSITIGSASLTEAELEMLDGITAGTALASKAVVLDGSKNITSMGTISAGAITSSGIVTGTAFTAGSAVLAEAELELLDGLTAGTAIASKVVTTDASIDTTGQRNLTISGELDAATGDFSGVVDIAGVTDIHGTLDMNSQDIDDIKSATFIAEVDNGNSSTADTIDWAAGQKQKSTLTGNCTYTFQPDPAGPCNLIFKVIQDGTGSRTVTWPGSGHVKWPAGTAPTLSTAANAVDIIAFYFDGTNYYGQSSLAFA